MQLINFFLQPRPLPLNFHEKKAVKSSDVLPFSLSQNNLVHQCIMGKKSAKSSLPPCCDSCDGVTRWYIEIVQIYRAPDGVSGKRKSGLSTITVVAGLLCRIRSNWSFLGESGTMLLGGGALVCGVLCATFETNMVKSTTCAVSPCMKCPPGTFGKGLVRPSLCGNPRIDLVIPP